MNFDHLWMWRFLGVVTAVDVDRSKILELLGAVDSGILTSSNFTMAIYHGFTHIIR